MPAVILKKSKAPAPHTWPLQVTDNIYKRLFACLFLQTLCAVGIFSLSLGQTDKQTYYLRTGLTDSTCDLVDFRHVTAMADYAMQLFNKIEEVNEHSFNNFRMRIGKFMEKQTNV